ncbi:MAG: hypothetical protein ACYDHZ_10495, partial [Dehalococcoidia bacterium]
EKEDIHPVPGQPGSYTYNLCIFNTTTSPSYTASYVYLYPPTGVTMVPNYFVVTIPHQPSPPFCTSVTISGPGVSSGQQIQFGISLHDQAMTQCCTELHKITIP